MPEYQLDLAMPPDPRGDKDAPPANKLFTQPGSQLSTGSRVTIEHYDDQPPDFLEMVIDQMKN